MPIVARGEIGIELATVGVGRGGAVDGAELNWESVGIAVVAAANDGIAVEAILCVGRILLGEGRVDILGRAKFGSGG